MKQTFLCIFIKNSENSEDFGIFACFFWRKSAFLCGAKRLPHRPRLDNGTKVIYNVIYIRQQKFLRQSAYKIAAVRIF